MTETPDFITPNELMEKYPTAKELGWTETKVNMFSRSGLLICIPTEKKSSFLVSEDSFQRLLQYTLDRKKK